jgi:hypothetical protein
VSKNITFIIWCESEKGIGNMGATYRKITKQNSGNMLEVPSETDVDTEVQQQFNTLLWRKVLFIPHQVHVIFCGE